MGAESARAKVKFNAAGVAGSAHVDVTKKILSTKVLAESPSFKTQATQLSMKDASPATLEDEEIAKEKRAAKNRHRKESRRAKKGVEKAAGEQSLRDVECSAAETETEK